MRKTTKVLSIILAFALMLSAVTMVAGAASFPDVPQGSNYEQAIDLLASLKILGGYEDGTFKPESNITRAEFSKIVYVIFNGLTDPDGKMFASETNFDDVATGAWFAGHVNWAYLNEIVGGYGDGTFLPNNNVAVKEAVKMIVTCITDKELTYPMGYIQEARALDLLDGVVITDTDAPATRGQIAQMASNLLVTNSRLCLASTGRMDVNGNEIYEKNPAITFVFGLNEVAGKESAHVAMVAGTYNNMFTAQTYLDRNLEEGEVAFWLYNKNAEGKADTLVSPKPYIYEYEGDISDLIGQYLTLYLTDKDELVAVVSRSNVISTTLNKMKANSGYATANVNGTTIAIDAYKDEKDLNSARGEMVRQYYFERLFIQSSDGTWTEEIAREGDLSSVKLSAIVSTSARAQDNPISVIDADGNGEYDTFIKFYAANHKIESYSYQAKTMTISYKSTDFVDPDDVAIGGKTMYVADYVDGFDKFKDMDFNDPLRPVYGNFYVTIKGDRQPYLTVNVSESVEGKLETIASNGKTAKVGGKSYTSYYLPSANDSYGFFHYNRGNLGQMVRLYFDDCGYAQSMIAIETAEDYGLNIVKVIDVTEEADRHGNGLAATMTVVDMDGNQKTHKLSIEQEHGNSEYAFYTEVPSDYVKSTSDELFWAADMINKRYKIVDEYVQLEIDEATGIVKKIMTIDELCTNGPTTSNTSVVWSGGTFTDMCYSEEKGFFKGTKNEVTEYYGWPAAEFKGMYHNENEEGILETAYYTADTIPEFYNQGKVALIKADREVVGMIILEAPASYVNDRVLGIVTGWQTVAGEKTINEKASYRYAVNVWTDGEIRTLYTEDFASNKLPTVEIERDTNREGLAMNQLVYIQLMSNGKIQTKISINGNGEVLDIAYLMNSDLTFAYTDYNRSNFYSVNQISKLVNTVPAGWSKDETGKDVYNASAISGSISVSGTSTARTCDETVYYTVNKTSNIMNTATGIFQTIQTNDIKVGGSVLTTDPDSGVYYVFAYTTLTEETAVDADNVGMMGTVYIFQEPVMVSR